ncbi:hypothetical protein RRG08_054752 [Elysia crispata]|uniref:Uncharacterized protein n=1 Tax=Elysia crispata TaxID=231223 RepID=A0AAE1B142_9GAST|nr:hypothetical protein RRG08_054752 [Elysia crispata]
MDVIFGCGNGTGQCCYRAGDESSKLPAVNHTTITVTEECSRSTDEWPVNGCRTLTPEALTASIAAHSDIMTIVASASGTFLGRLLVTTERSGTGDDVDLPELENAQPCLF